MGRQLSTMEETEVAIPLLVLEASPKVVAVALIVVVAVLVAIKGKWWRGVSQRLLGGKRQSQGTACHRLGEGTQHCGEHGLNAVAGSSGGIRFRTQVMSGLLSSLLLFYVRYHIIRSFCLDRWIVDQVSRVIAAVAYTQPLSVLLQAVARNEHLLFASSEADAVCFDLLFFHLQPIPVVRVLSSSAEVCCDWRDALTFDSPFDFPFD